MGIIMNHFLKNLLLPAVLFVVVGFTASAQKFTTHAVKQGETLQSIAKQYKVAPSSILTYNKEIKQGQKLKANTILVVPTGGAPVKSGAGTMASEKEKTTVSMPVQEEPIGFTSHKVKRKETLYSISKRYRITEEDIKRYNKELYSTQLKKKMVLRIPKYKRVKPADVAMVNEGDFETYVVAPKETRWSIAHKYGITIDSMVALNPALAKGSSYLAEGQELRMPKRPGSRVQNQVAQLYTSYVVPPKMNFYQLEKKFNLKSDEIVKLNPEITERGGLKEGMVLRIPSRTVAAGEVNTDNFIFYEVKPKQTEFYLTRKLGLSYKELLALNPALKDGLKAGMVLKLPKEQVGDFEVRDALVLDKINLVDSINIVNRPKVMFILPFRTDLASSDKDAAKKMIAKRTDAKISLGLYSGALVALDSVASLGISVDVKTFDNQLSVAKTKEILLGEDLSDVQAIIGPLDASSLREVAVRASGLKVPVVAPVPVSTNLSMSNVFFSYTSEKVLRKRMLDYIAEHKTDQQVIVIADKKNAATKNRILQQFPDAKIVEVIEEKKNIGIRREKLAEILSTDVENWVIVETDNFKLASSVTSILNSFQNSALDAENQGEEKVMMKMFTTDKNKAFENDIISSTHLSNLKFTYPSAYREVGNNSFTKRYRKKFGDTPDKYAVRGFDLTYDLLLKLAYKNNLIEASKLIGQTEYTGNKFSYKKDLVSGYFNQASYILSYDDMRIKAIK